MPYAISYHFVANRIPLNTFFWAVSLLPAMSDFKVRFLWSPLAAAERPVKMAVLPESIGKGIYEMRGEYEFLRCNPHGRSLEENCMEAHPH